MFPPKKPEPKYGMEQSAPQTPIGMLRSTPQVPIGSERSAPQIPNYTGPSPKTGPHQWGSIPNYSPSPITAPISPSAPPPTPPLVAGDRGLNGAESGRGWMNPGETPEQYMNAGGGSAASTMSMEDFTRSGGNPANYNTNDSPTHNQGGLMAEFVDRPSYVPFQGDTTEIEQLRTNGTPPWVDPSVPPPAVMPTPPMTSPVTPSVSPIAPAAPAPESMSNQLLSSVRKPGLQRLPTWFK